MAYNWSLNESQFTVLDRLKICSFFLNPKNKWTQDKYVKQIESEMAKYVGCQYSVFVSSGSTANTLLAMWAKDHIYSPEKNIVVLPAVTWQTSCSPWIREGFEPVFIDINLNNLSMDLNKLEDYLDKNYSKVATVFITTLLGFSPDILKIKSLERKYPSIKFSMDNCEATLSDCHEFSEEGDNISQFFTSTTSTYFGHQIQSVEGGFVFTNSLEEYIYFLMGRNHGMTKSLINYEHIIGKADTQEYLERRKNSLVDSRFDFYMLGNNFRNSEINAYIGLLDLKRAKLYKNARSYLYSVFRKNINKNLFVVPEDYKKSMSGSYEIPFSIPIIFNPAYFKGNKIKNECINKLEEVLKIETRPIISGNLLRQTAYKNYGAPEKFTSAEVLHNNGLYVGLHSLVKEDQVIELTSFLNELAADHIDIAAI